MFENINQVEALIGRLIDKLDASNIGAIELEADDVKIKLDKHAIAPKATLCAEPLVQTVPAVETPAATVSVPEITENTVKAPLIGVAYAAASPDSAPFVKVGDQVKKGDVICIIEAMKVMNEIEADRDGEVCAVLFENGKMVEYGDPLISIR